MAVFKFIMIDIVTTPALLVSLIAMLGLILQKKSASEVIASGLKTATGYVIFTCGSTIITGVLNFLGPVIQSAFHLSAPVAASSGMGYDTFVATWGGYATVAVTIGFIINLLLAKFTKFKYIYLTGHLMISAAAWMVAGLLATDANINPLVAIVVTGIVLGLYWTLQPAYMDKYMKVITGGDDLAYGHTSSITCWIAAVLGKLIGKKDESAEEIKLPESIEVFKDTIVSLSLVLGIFCVVIALIAGPEIVGQYSGTSNYITYSLIQGFTFSAGIAVILYGVRLIIGELVPAFRGISKKLVPGAKPAMDCPIIFSFGPTSMVIGFLASFVGFMLSMFFIGFAGWGVVIPFMISIFFPGAAAGIYGNSTGGWRGAVLGGFITGVLLAFGQLIVANATATSVPYLALSADPDTHVLTMVGTWLGSLLRAVGL